MYNAASCVACNMELWVNQRLASNRIKCVDGELQHDGTEDRANQIYV